MGRRLPYLWPKDKEGQERVLKLMKKDLEHTKAMNKIVLIAGVFVFVFFVVMLIIKL